MAEKLISKRQAGKAFETERLARSRAARAERETSTAAEELANAIMSAGTDSVSGPAQVQTPASPPQAIQTPELDSFRGNATGNTWEDTNALARQLDAEKAREAELQKTPERNVGGGLTTRQFEQAHGERDFTTGDVLANAGRRLVGDTLGGVRNTINYYGSYVPASIAETVKDPSKSPNRLEQFQYDFDSDPHAMDAYNAWKASLKPGEYEALEMSGQLPDPRSLYAQQRLQQMSDEYQKDYVEPELKSIVDFGRGFQAETEEKYGNMTGLGGVIGDLAGTIGQMSPAMALNHIPYVGPVASTAYLLGSAAGNATEQAYANGASLQQAVDYGTMSGAVEAATEKMFDGMAGLLGKGAADDIVEGVIGKLTSGSGNNALRNALRLGFGALGEGAEEGISGIVEPLLRTIYNNKGLIESYKDLDQKDLWYQIMLGALSGGVLGSIGMVNGQFAGKNAELEVNRVAQQIVDDYLANTPEGQATVNRVENSPVGENTTQTQAPADDRLFHEPVNRSTANRILFDPEQRAALEAETGVSLSNMSIRDAANLIMEYSRQSAETGRTGFDVAYPIKTPQAPKQFDHALTRSEAMRVANDPTLRVLFEQETGRTIPGKKYAVQFIQNVTAQLAEQANAPAAPTSPIAQTVIQNEAQQQAQAPAPQEQAPAPVVQQQAPTPQTQTQTTAQQQQSPPPGQLRSQSEANTIQAVDEKVGAPQEVRNPIYYSPVSENESISMARDFLTNGYESNAPARASADITPEQGEALTAAGQRLGGNYAKAIADLQGPGSWSGVQTDMSTLIMEALADDAARANDWSAYEAWREIDRVHGTEGARAQQARAKRTRATDIINATIDEINRLGISGDAKTKVLDEALPFAKEVERVLNSADPDPAKLRDVITRISEQRHTGTIIPGLMQKLLDGQTDMEYLADLAKASVRGFAADAIPANAGQVLKSWQSIAMLLKLTTTIRNLGGNSTFGVLDTLVGDVFGVALDRAVSGATGKRAVAFDTRWLNSTQRQGARDAFNKAVLEIALDTDIGSVDTKYFPNSRTFDPGSRNPVVRALSRAEQILGYTLNASDRLYRGGIQSGNTEALTRLNEVKPLTDQEIADIEQKIRAQHPNSRESTIERLVQKRMDEVMRQREAALQKEIKDSSEKKASYMLFQNKGAASTAARSVHDFLNLAGVGGELQGVRRVGGFGLGDIVTPFASVPANLGVKAFEYSPAGMMKGIYDLAKVLHDAKTGKSTIAQQQKAVMEISRGVTGIPLAMAFAALIKGGLIKRSSDDDDYDVTKARQSEGRKETQWNLSATMRAIQGKSPEWQEGDKIASLSWLEPLNAFMDIGAMFAQIPEYDDDGFWKKLGYYANKGTRAYLAGAFDAFMEIPMMNNLQSAMQTFQYMDADNNLDRIVNSAEDLLKSGVTGMFPGLVAQIARAMDPTTRDTSADTFIQELGNALVNQIPVARESLPEKLDSFGQPVTSNNEALNALSNLILPGAVNEYTPKDVVQALDSVYEATGKSTFYPDYKAPNKFNYGGTDYELTTDEKRTYQENFGQRYNELMQSVIDSKLYGRMTDAERAEVFGNIRNLAAAEARGEIVTGRGGEYSSDYDKVSELSDIAGYYSTKAILDSAAGDADKRNFSRISEVLDSYRTLPDDVKAKLAANDSTNYLDELSEAWNRGVSVENWFKAHDAKDGLTPYGDNKQVADWQKYQAMANVSTDKDMDVMLRSYMDDTAYDKYAAARSEGLSARDWADARAAAGALEPVEGKETLADWQKYEAYANVLDDKGMDAMMTGYTEGTTLENYLAAREAGASAKDWAAAMAAAGKLTPWSEDGEVKKWQKYQAYAETVDEDTADAIFSAYLTENQARLYADARSAGVTPQQWAEANAGVARLTPYGDNKGVTEWQQYEYITRLYPDQAEALIPYFIETDGMRERFQTAMDYGVSPTLWANFYKQYSLNNGRKDASISWMLGQGYNKKQAEYMYYLFKEKVANLASFNDKYK